MAAMLRSSSAAALRRLLLLSRATTSSSSFSSSAVRSPSSPRVIPAAASSHRISGSSFFPSSFQSTRTITSSASNLPEISDLEIDSAFRDLMAAAWDHLPESIVSEAKKAACKETPDIAGQKRLKELFAAAEACEEFGGTLVSLRMALDDLSGITGENVGPLPGYIQEAVKSAYNRYMTYLNSFGPEETYLRKKVETELGTKMIHLKMRCSGIGSEWGTVSLLGTSGISGSYVELRS